MKLRTRIELSVSVLVVVAVVALVAWISLFPAPDVGESPAIVPSGTTPADG